jgi:hypothetical protein
LVGLAIAVAVVAFIIAKSGGNDSSNTVTSTGRSTSSATSEPRIQVKNGKPVGGVQKIEFKKGGTVRFSVTSDVADEIHVHGYDLKKDVPKGGTVRFSFPASIDGGFVVELESRGEQIAELEVQP